MLKNLEKKIDYIGALASLVCLIHCMATPFIFIARTCALTCCSETPFWWRAVDYFFLIISFMAIYFAAKNTSKTWAVRAMWLSWIVLFFIIVNESLDLIMLPQSAIYFPAISLVGLHFYNQKFCKCTSKGCCVNS